MASNPCPFVSLSPTQRTPSSSQSSPGNNTSSFFPIRAPPSFDSDSETPIKIKTCSSNSNSSSSSSIGCGRSSTSSEEGFVSGEDEERLKLDEGSSGLRPKAQLSGEFDDDVGDESEVEDDELLSGGEVEKVGGVVEKPKVRVFSDEEGEEGEEGECSNGGFGEGYENGGLGYEGKGDWVKGDSGLLVLVADVGLFRKSGNGGLSLEEKGIPVLDSASGELVGERVSDLNDVNVEALLESVGSKEESIADNLKFDEVVNFPDLNDVSNFDGVKSNVVEHIEPEEYGSSDVKEVRDPVKESTFLGRGDGPTYFVIEELDDSKLVGGIKNEDSPIEPKLLGLEICPVRDAKEEGVHSETEVPALAVEKTEIDQAVPVRSILVEEGIDIKKVDEPSDLCGTTEQDIELLEPKGEVEEVEKGNDGMNDVGVNENVSLDLNSYIVEPELETELRTDSGTEHNKEAALGSSSHAAEPALPTSVITPEVIEEVGVGLHPDDDENDNGSVLEENTEGLTFGGSATAQLIVKTLTQGSGVSSRSDGESSGDHSGRLDGKFVTDSDEEVDTDQEGEGRELFDSAALTALLKAASNAGSESGTVTITSSDGSKIFSVERPTGSESSGWPLRPAPRPNLFTPLDHRDGEESEHNLSDGEKKKLENIQLIRVKFLRLVHRLGCSGDDPLAAQVLYRLGLAAGRHTSQDFSLETAKRIAMELETEGKDDLDFSLNILVLGKTGVGKSSTINSIFGEERARISAFEPATTAVKEISGTVGGVKIRVFDTPGLRSSVMEQNFNRKMLLSVKKITKKYPPDILLYVDRMDGQTRDLNDLPALRSITNTLGSSIWRTAVIVLTHAASPPPEGPSGFPLGHEMFAAQRSQIVQQLIGQAAGDLRMMNPSLMNPVSLVENHQSCKRNSEGQKILPTGQSWQPQLLLVCYSLRILSEVSSLSKPQDLFDHRKLFGFRFRSPPLSYLLSSLLQSRAHPKLPNDQGVENVDSDADLEDMVDSEQEDDYDQLPPFRPLKKSQIAKLSKEQRNAYFEEYDYRVKLFQKKQWKEELKRMREMKKRGKGHSGDYGDMGEDAEQENGDPAQVPVPLPDMVLPPSFDGDNPAYRYRFLEPTSQLLSRPVLDTHGWDHDCGYDGISLEENLAIAGRFPAGVAVQITKDKKEFTIHLDSSVAAKHGEDGSSLAGFDIQTVGKQLAYILRGETKFKKLKKNKMIGGISVTFLGETVATGLKVEDQISIGKRLTLVGSTGTIRSQGDAAYGANFEARLKDKDYPVGQDESALGVSIMKGRGDLAVGANLQSQVSVGRSTKMALRVGLNNKLSGQITLRTSSSDKLQVALVGILPIAISIYRNIWRDPGESYSSY